MEKRKHETAGFHPIGAQLARHRSLARSPLCLAGRASTRAGSGQWPTFSAATETGQPRFLATAIHGDHISRTRKTLSFLGHAITTFIFFSPFRPPNSVIQIEWVCSFVLPCVPRACARSSRRAESSHQAVDAPDRDGRNGQAQEDARQTRRPFFFAFLVGGSNGGICATTLSHLPRSGGGAGPLLLRARRDRFGFLKFLHQR